MKKYEMIVVVSGQLPEDMAQEMTGKAKKTVEEVGGLKIVADFWGRRRLAYKIQGQDHGYYAVFNFSLDPQKISELEAEIRMISEIIRFMVITDDKKAEVVKIKKVKKEDQLESEKLVTGEGVKEEQKEEVGPEVKEDVNKATNDQPKVVKTKKVVEKVQTEEAVGEEIEAAPVNEEKPKLKVKTKAEKADDEEKEDEERLEELDKKIDEILND